MANRIQDQPPSPPNPQKRSAPVEEGPVSKIARTAQMAIITNEILPVDQLRVLLNSNVAAEDGVKKRYISYVLSNTDLPSGFKPTIRTLLNSDGVTEAQRGQAKRLLSTSMRSFADFNALQKSGELSESELFDVLIEMDPNVLFYDRKLIGQLLAICSVPAQFDALCEKARELLSPEKEQQLTVFFSSLAATRNFPVSNALFEACFNKLGMGRKLEVFCEYSKWFLRMKDPFENGDFIRKMLEILKGVMRKESPFQLSSLENAYQVNNPFLHLESTPDSYFLILLGAIAEDQDALEAYHFKLHEMGLTVFNFDKAPVSTFNQAARIYRREKEVPKLKNPSPYVQFFLDFDLSTNRIPMLGQLSNYLNLCSNHKTLFDQAYLLHIRATFFYLLENYLPLKNEELRSEYRFFHLGVKTLSPIAANMIRSLLPPLEEMEGIEAKRLLGILGFLSSSEVDGKAKALQVLVDNGNDPHSLYFVLSVLAEYSTFPTFDRETILEQLKGYYLRELQGLWGPKEFEDIETVFDLNSRLSPNKRFEGVFNVFTARAQTSRFSRTQLAYYSRLQASLCLPITLFLVNHHDEQEYLHYLEPFYEQLAHLKEQGFAEALSSLDYLEKFCQGLLAKIHPPIVTRFVDEMGHRLSNVLLSPLPPIKECDHLYTPAELTRLIFSYTGCIATFASSMNLATDIQQEAVAEKYETPFGALTEDERIEGFQSLEKGYQEAYLRSRGNLLGYVSPFREQLIQWWQGKIGVYFKPGVIDKVSEEEKVLVAKMCTHIFRHYETLEAEKRDTKLVRFAHDVNACTVRVETAAREHYDAEILGRAVLTGMLLAVQIHCLLPMIKHYVNTLSQEAPAEIEGQPPARLEGPSVHLMKHYSKIVKEALNLVPENDKQTADNYRIFFIDPKQPQEVIDTLMSAELTTSTIIAFLKQLFMVQQAGIDRTFVNLVVDQAQRVDIAPDVDENGLMVLSSEEWRELLLRTKLIETAEENPHS